MSTHSNAIRGRTTSLGAKFHDHDLDGHADAPKNPWADVPRFLEFMRKGSRRRRESPKLPKSQPLDATQAELRSHSIDPQGSDPDSDLEYSTDDDDETVEHTFHAKTDVTDNNSFVAFPPPRSDSTASVIGSEFAETRTNPSSLALIQATERAVHLIRSCRYFVRTMANSFRASTPWLEFVDPTCAAWVMDLEPAAASCHKLEALFSGLLDSLSQPAHERHKCPPQGPCAHTVWHTYHEARLARLTRRLERFVEHFSRSHGKTPRKFTLAELASVLAQHSARFQTSNFDIKRSWLKLDRSTIAAALRESEGRVPSAAVTLDAATDNARAAAAARNTAQADLKALQRNQEELRLQEAEINRKLKALSGQK
ncbi:hypothetical protein MSAN_00740900 [Mycena sanguinolenta]|uniref:Uncharacterized protein n=1 Tax=Mycena sanguinolenta TaxID=230812 RepID=A0A8H7DGZ6_9AGAR|nr:hypothetical protein MSAN_00740900 [Mycena sanguinolenta]